MKAVFYAEIIFLFENDICERELFSILSINEYIFLQKSKNTVNPITKEKNEGYWSHKFSEIESYDCEDIQNEILFVLNEHCDEFRQVLECYGSRLIVRIFVNVKDEYPVFMFENKFLKSISDLGATLDIVVI